MQQLILIINSQTRTGGMLVVTWLLETFEIVLVRLNICMVSSKMDEGLSQRNKNLEMMRTFPFLSKQDLNALKQFLVEHHVVVIVSCRSFDIQARIVFITLVLLLFMTTIESSRKHVRLSEEEETICWWKDCDEKNKSFLSLGLLESMDRESSNCTNSWIQ